MRVGAAEPVDHLAGKPAEGLVVTFEQKVEQGLACLVAIRWFVLVRRQVVAVRCLVLEAVAEHGREIQVEERVEREAMSRALDGGRGETGAQRFPVEQRHRRHGADGIE